MMTITEINKYLMYTDENNLYGWEMSLALPMGMFKQMIDEEIKCLDVHKTSNLPTYTDTL